MNILNNRSEDYRNTFETIVLSFKTIYNGLVGWYFDKLNTGLYERWIKNIFLKKHVYSEFELESYKNFLNGVDISELADTHIAHKIILYSTVVFTILLQFYLIFSCLCLSDNFVKIFNSKMLGSISFYTFFVLPFKTSNFLVLIREFSTRGLSYFGIPDFVGIDELVFIICALLFFLFRYIVAIFCKRLKNHEHLIKAAQLIKYSFRIIKIVVFTTIILLCSLNTLLSIGSIYFMIGNALLLLFFLVGPSLFRRDFYFYSKNFFKWINANAFCLIVNFTRLFYFAICFFLFLDILLPDATPRNYIYLISDGLFQSIFGQKAEPVSILVKIIIIVLLIQYTAIENEASIYNLVKEIIDINNLESIELINDLEDLQKYKEKLFDASIFNFKTLIYQDQGIEFFRKAAEKWKMLGEKHKAVFEKIRETEESMRDPRQVCDYRAKFFEAKMSILEKLETINFESTLDQKRFKPENETMYRHFLNAIDAIIDDHFFVISENLNNIISLMESRKDFSLELNTVILSIKKVNFLRSNYKFISNLRFCNGPWAVQNKKPAGSQSLSSQSSSETDIAN